MHGDVGAAVLQQFLFSLGDRIGVSRARLPWIGAGYRSLPSGLAEAEFSTAEARV